MGTALKTAAAAATAAAVAGAATTIGALYHKKAIEGYAAQERKLVGGVETLSKRRLIRLLVMQTTHIKQPECLQNEYMETVTSFSASLLASMNNDNGSGSRKGKQWQLRICRDNANKMGIDISRLYRTPITVLQSQELYLCWIT